MAARRQFGNVTAIRERTRDHWGSVEVTALLQPSNRLSLELTVDHAQLAAEPYGLWRPVVLEIVTPE